jgi:hypothetical protein
MDVTRLESKRLQVIANIRLIECADALRGCPFFGLTDTFPTVAFLRRK